MVPFPEPCRHTHSRNTHPASLCTGTSSKQNGLTAQHVLTFMAMESSTKCSQTTTSESGSSQLQVNKQYVQKQIKVGNECWTPSLISYLVISRPRIQFTATGDLQNTLCPKKAVRQSLHLKVDYILFHMESIFHFPLLKCYFLSNYDLCTSCLFSHSHYPTWLLRNLHCQHKWRIPWEHRERQEEVCFLCSGMSFWSLYCSGNSCT